MTSNPLSQIKTTELMHIQYTVSGVICSISGCSNTWKKRRILLEQHKTVIVVGHHMPYMFKALNLIYPNVAYSYHFLKRKIKPEHLYPEKLFIYEAPFEVDGLAACEANSVYYCCGFNLNQWIC